MTIAEEKDGNGCSTPSWLWIKFFTNRFFLHIFKRSLPAVIVPIFGAICQLSRRGSASSAGSLKPWNHSADTEPQARGTKYSHTVKKYLRQMSKEFVSKVKYICVKNQKYLWPIPSSKLAALNTRTQCRISPPRPRCVCVRTTKCLKNTDFPSRAHLNTRAVKMCQMSPEFGFLTLPSGECEYTLRENHGREVVLIYYCCFIVLLSVGMIDQIPWWYLTKNCILSNPHVPFKRCKRI